MVPVHRQTINHNNAGNAGHADNLLHRLQFKAGAALDHQQAAALVIDTGKPPQAKLATGRCLHREWIGGAKLILHPGKTPAHEPETPLPVDGPGIAGAVPYLAADGELGLDLAAPVHIGCHHMIGSYHHLTNLTGLETILLELGTGERADRHTVIIRQDGKLYLRYRLAHQDATPDRSRETIGGNHVGEGLLSNRVYLGVAIDNTQRAMLQRLVQLLRDIRVNRTGDDHIIHRQAVIAEAVDQLGRHGR